MAAVIVTIGGVSSMLREASAYEVYLQVGKDFGVQLPSPKVHKEIKFVAWDCLLTTDFATMYPYLIRDGMWSVIVQIIQMK